jgi:hypothetical protein
VPSSPKRPESDLSAPIKEYLLSLGYTVRAEVRHCDITATTEETLVVVELKRAFSTDLLIQAVERQRVSDAVYIALPAEGSFAPGKRYDQKRRGIETLLKRLALGLLLVHYSPTPDTLPTVEAVLHPEKEVRPRSRPKQRQRILREIAGRSDDYNVGGTTGIKRITAYREQAVFLVACLEVKGTQSPAALCVLGANKTAAKMLFRNVYGWFVREGRGLYSLAPTAISELERDYPQVLASARERVAQADWRAE